MWNSSSNFQMRFNGDYQKNFPMTLKTLHNSEWSFTKLLENYDFDILQDILHMLNSAALNYVFHNWNFSQLLKFPL
jgi:hypothetical protein